ncbi:hypothetical protein AMECASPLE_038146 [Ameca splendens]|uniref:Uncharacterized protein n=1 Tax=Ameca splendens TaxID=208324 RepID=A0ABV0YJJ3_9TELE
MSDTRRPLGTNKHLKQNNPPRVGGGRPWEEGNLQEREQNIQEADVPEVCSDVASGEESDDPGVGSDEVASKVADGLEAGSIVASGGDAGDQEACCEVASGGDAGV